MGFSTDAIHAGQSPDPSTGAIITPIFKKVLRRFGTRFSYVDSSKLEKVEQEMGDDVSLVFLESPTNPVLRITYIAAVAELAHRHGARVVVDNTFMSPFLPETTGAGSRSGRP